MIGRDNDDCRKLRRDLDGLTTAAGLRAHGPDRNVLNRVAVEELEAWFVGDMAALSAAYPRVPPSSGAKRVFRDPDAVVDTWEAREGLLKRHGYHKSGLLKVATTVAFAEHMDVEKNEPKSFQVFRDGLRRFVETEVM